MNDVYKVEVDSDVFEYLKQSAEPFVDTPNSVLRRLLGLGSSGDAAPGTKPTSGSRKATPAKAAPSKRTRARTGTLLEQKAYFEPILRVLRSKGGRAPTREVLDELGDILDDQLTAVDRQRISSGGVRWENRAQFARLELVKRGLLKSDSPRGLWEISDQGITQLEDDGRP